MSDRDIEYAGNDCILCADTGWRWVAAPGGGTDRVPCFCMPTPVLKPEQEQEDARHD